MKEINLSDHFTYQKLLLFAMPTIGMILISITYDVVDGYFTSNYIGKTAFSAVNIVYPFQLLLSMVGYMFGTGGSALIASQLGKGEPVFYHDYPSCHSGWFVTGRAGHDFPALGRLANRSHS